MRSTMRTSGRVILNVLIHSAKAPASRVETMPTSAMLVTAWLALAFKPWLALALAASSASLKAFMSPISGAHVGVDVGGEARGVSHLDEVDLLDADAVNQAGRVEADLHRLLGLLGDLVEPLLELADLGRLVGQMRGREAQQHRRLAAPGSRNRCFAALRAGIVLIVEQHGEDGVRHAAHRVGGAGQLHRRQVALLDDVARGRADADQPRRAEDDHRDHHRRHHRQRDQDFGAQFEIVDIHQPIPRDVDLPCRRAASPVRGASSSASGFTQNSGSRPARTDGYTPASVGRAVSLACRREIKPL